MTEVTQADPFERWPGYNEQSWPERFAELERRSRENITDLVDTLIVHRTAEAAKDARIKELEADAAAGRRNVYRLQTGGDRLCATLRLIAAGAPDPAKLARKALDHNEPDPKDWNAALKEIDNAG